MSQHTPGPWKVVDGYYPCFIEIEGASFRPAIVTHATNLTLEDTRRRRADAQLMAAAPELTAALEGLVAAVEKFAVDPEDWPEMKVARAAITKASKKTKE